MRPFSVFVTIIVKHRKVGTNSPSCLEEVFGQRERPAFPRLGSWDSSEGRGSAKVEEHCLYHLGCLGTSQASCVPGAFYQLVHSSSGR